MFGNRDGKEDINSMETPTVSPKRERSSNSSSSNRDKSTITAFLGPDTSFEGTLTFEHSVLIEGNFKGQIESKGQLVIGESAHVEADINSRTVTIKGTVKGTVEASERIQIQNNATVLGDITTPSLQMDETVTFEGKCCMGKPAASRGNKARETEKAEQTKDAIVDAVESVTT